MSINSYENEIRQVFGPAFKSGDIKDIGSSDQFFERLEGEYPVFGSKIDWDNTINSFEMCCGNMDRNYVNKKFLDFFNYIININNITGDVIYIGDGLTDFTLFCSMSKMKEIVPYLVENIPHHHYWISFDFSWCISYTMEGDMAFGYRPPR